MKSPDFMDFVDHLPDGFYAVDRNRKITFWNRAAERITGYSAKEVIGRGCSDNILVHVDEEGRSLCRGNCPVAATLKDGRSREAEVYLRHKDGHRVPVWVRATRLRDDQGRIIGSAELFSDLSFHRSRLLRIQELEKLALLDPLTQLSNRRHLEVELKARLEEKRRYGLSFGLMFLDVDHFKRFNDTHGHDIGDLALRTVANNLMSSARPFDLFGRWGGEEFLGLIRNVEIESVGRIAERYRMLIENSRIPINGSHAAITVSIGATVAGDDDTEATLVKRADDLMYSSKSNGRNRVTIDE